MNKELRPQISADLLLDAVRQGNNKVTIAMIHPDDHNKLSEEVIDLIKIKLRITGLLPSAKVERGWLYVDSQPLK